jgi:CDGSH-type Zn-finger protein
MRSVEPSVTAYRDGPFLVRGPIRLVDEEGRSFELRRDVVALCRCGRSRIKPLCDGTHAAGPRRVPDEATGPEISSPAATVPQAALGSSSSDVR